MFSTLSETDIANNNNPATSIVVSDNTTAISRLSDTSVSPRPSAENSLTSSLSSSSSWSSISNK